MALSIIKILFLFIMTGMNNHDINISAYLNKHLSDYNKIEYTIISPKNIDLSSCVFDDSRIFRIEGNYAYLPVQLSNKSGLQRNTLITLKLKLFKNVLVANRVIRKKENLNINDFKVLEREVSTLRFNPLDASSTINQLRTKFKISENSILQQSMVERIPDVRIGDRIEAMFSNNSVNVRFAVTARSEGIVGEIIDIKRDDKKLFKAEILNNTTVRIIE